jgi:hypothetical protein
MSSGQQRVVFNNGERVMSGDFNKLQDLIARERNEIFRALLQQTWSPATPGVTIRADGALPDTPLAAVVLDGLEAIVDSPGHVMISPGTLAGWYQTPATPNSDSGFQIVDSDGINDLRDEMVIVENLGSSARCDVIEVGFDANEITTVENRDIYDPITEEFTPAPVTKTARHALRFRVRTGTPGVPPGVVIAWLPIALAIVQPGATVAQVDFYDVRPLWRDMAGESNYESVLSGASTVNRRGSHHVVCSGSGTIATSHFYGRVDAEFGKVDISGQVRRNTPINQVDLAQWGLTTAYAGGDSTGVPLTTATAVRGAAVAISAHDTLVLCACFPTLGSAVGPVPRCVRYSQSAANNGIPAHPARRRPVGTNGILMWISKLQEDADITLQSVYPIDLQAPGFDGCVGNANCVPLAVVTVNRSGTDIFPTQTGAFYGGGILDGVPTAQNQLLKIADMTGAISTTVGPTPDHPLSDEMGLLPGIAIINAVFEDESANLHDRLDITFGRLLLLFDVDGVVDAGGGIRAYITEDVYGTPHQTTLLDWHSMAIPGSSPVSSASGSRYFDAQRSIVITHPGVVRVTLEAYNVGGVTMTVSNAEGSATIWGTYRRYTS